MIKNYSDGTSAVTLGNGQTVINQGPVVRLQGTYDASIGALIDQAEKAPESMVFNPQKRPPSLQTIQQDTIFVQMKPEVKQAHGLNTFYGAPTVPTGFIQGFSNVAGLPAVPFGVQLSKKNRKLAAKTATLDSVVAVGVAAQQMQVGTATPTPITNGIPVDAQVHKTMIFPMDKKPDLFTPQKLSVYTGDDPNYDGRFTLEPITAQCLSRAMKTNIEKYDEAVNGGDSEAAMKNVYETGGLRPFSGDGVTRFDRRLENGAKAKFGAYGMLLKMLSQIAKKNGSMTVTDAMKLVKAHLEEDGKSSSKTKAKGMGGGEGLSEQNVEGIKFFLQTLKTYTENPSPSYDNFEALFATYMSLFVAITITKQNPGNLLDSDFEFQFITLDDLSAGKKDIRVQKSKLKDFLDSLTNGSKKVVQKLKTEDEQKDAISTISAKLAETASLDGISGKTPDGILYYSGSKGGSSNDVNLNLFGEDSDMIVDVSMEETAMSHGFTMFVEACAETMLVENKAIAVFTGYRTNETDGMRDQNNCYETLDTLVQIF